MKPVIIYLKPKDGVLQVEEALKEIDCPKLFLKYIPYPAVYKIALDWIKGHPEFDYIIWVQNDIVFNKAAFEHLTKGIESSRVEILGLAMNVDLTPKGLDLLAYTTKPFSLEKPVNPEYTKRGTHKGIIRVFHNGGVFICKRDFYLQFPLKGVGRDGFNADALHGTEIRELNQSYWLDSSYILQHRRYEGSMQVHKKAMEINFER